MVGKYITRYCEIEAIRWDGRNLEDVKNFVGESLIYDIYDAGWKAGAVAPGVDIHIKTLEGDMRCSVGDYIIKGLCGEFYPCKPEVFEQKYEFVAMMGQYKINKDSGDLNEK